MLAGSKQPLQLKNSIYQRIFFSIYEYINYKNSHTIKYCYWNITKQTTFTLLYFFQKPIYKLLYTTHPVQYISYFYFMKILLKIKHHSFKIECARFLYLLYNIAEYFRFLKYRVDWIKISLISILEQFFLNMKVKYFNYYQNIVLHYKIQQQNTISFYQIEQQTLSPNFEFLKYSQNQITFIIYFNCLQLFNRIAKCKNKLINIQTKKKLKQYCSGLGSAFFVGFSGFLIYLIIIIYFRYLKGRSSRESYFENFLNGGLETSDLQQNFKLKPLNAEKKSDFILFQAQIIEELHEILFDNNKVC
ncbi:unnamed protein product [Paramecium primaurelia]|uniref:Transmembrane protein n=1 Tax=Paramecium primaurelia TaxID=5886 RepID=A0A8S1LHF7_PARPR|nr:unnamed protein product [Paramecium primaurelia]